MRRHSAEFEKLSPEEINKKEEDKKKQQEEFDLRTQEIINILENSPAIREIKEYLSLNPIPERKPPEQPEKIPFPAHPQLPEYKIERCDESVVNSQGEKIYKYWVCQSCGVKVVAEKDGVSEITDEDGEAYKVKSVLSFRAPVGFNFRGPGGPSGGSSGRTPPPECCYNEVVEKYNSDCVEVNKKNERIQAEWKKLIDEYSIQYAEDARKWLENAPKKVKAVFPQGRPNIYGGTYIGKWILSIQFNIQHDPIFRKYVLKDLEEIEKL